jgi:hypothetical protein
MLLRRDSAGARLNEFDPPVMTNCTAVCAHDARFIPVLTAGEAVCPIDRQMTG